MCGGYVFTHMCALLNEKHGHECGRMVHTWHIDSFSGNLMISLNYMFDLIHSHLFGKNITYVLVLNSIMMLIKLKISMGYN